MRVHMARKARKLTLEQRQAIRQIWREHIAIRRKLLDIDLEMADHIERKEVLRAGPAGKKVRRDLIAIEKRLGDLMNESELLRGSLKRLNDLAEEYKVCRSYITYCYRPRF